MFKHLRLKRPLVVIDVESTGVNLSIDRIIEVAVLKCLSGDKPMSFVRRLNPGMPIPTAAAIRGLTDADVAKCRSFVGIARKLALFLDGCDLAGFGIKKFDLPLLIAEFRRAGVSFPLGGCAVIDVLQVYHQREPRDLQSAFAFYVGGRFESAHRARGDVKATALVLRANASRRLCIIGCTVVRDKWAANDSPGYTRFTEENGHARVPGPDAVGPVRRLGGSAA
jgi:DNA polymerase III subunit epsilon